MVFGGRRPAVATTEGCFVNRLWGRIGVRATSVGLLVAGVLGGVYLGQSRDTPHGSDSAQLVIQADADEDQLVKQRQVEHAAARAWQRQAESDAAAKAAAEARGVASKARKLEKKVIAQKAEKKAAKDGALIPYAGPIPSSCQEYSGNRKTGCALMLAAGFKIDQFPCLNKLWNKESGWNARARNKSSGAYGIPQAYPGDKMSSVASDWKTNPATQIKWGLGYIEGRYDNPCGAWAHSESTGSY
jgi:hypothetical protein